MFQFNTIHSEATTGFYKFSWLVDIEKTGQTGMPSFTIEDGQERELWSADNTTWLRENFYNHLELYFKDGCKVHLEAFNKETDNLIPEEDLKEVFEIFKHVVKLGLI